MAVAFGLTMAVAVALGSVAWACSPSAYLAVDDAGTGRPGSSVRVSGAGYYTTGEVDPGTRPPQQAGPVEVRWNGLSGRLLNSAAGPNFSVSVTIPETATPGVYTIVGVQRGTTGEVMGQRSVSVEVRAATSSGAGTSSNTNGSTSGVSEEDPATTAPPQTTGTQSGAKPTVSSAQATDTAEPAPAGENGTAQSSQPATAANSTAVNSGAASTARNPSPAPVTSGSAAAAGAPASAVAAAPAPDAAPLTAEETPAVAAQKAWDGATQATTDRQLPSLDDNAPGGTQDSSGMLAGMAMLGVGLATVFSGFTVATVQRRRRALV